MEVLLKRPLSETRDGIFVAHRIGVVRLIF
jgi:hypothetical protein